MSSESFVQMQQYVAQEIAKLEHVFSTKVESKDYAERVQKEFEGYASKVDMDPFYKSVDARFASQAGDIAEVKRRVGVLKDRAPADAR